MIRLHGDLTRLQTEPLQQEVLEQVLMAVMTSVQQSQFQQSHECDFSIDVCDVSRFRVNVFQQARGVAAVFRVISHQIPSLQALHASNVFSELIRAARGLVLVTGPTGSGKSTTLATMMQMLNQTQNKHMVTIEDPIEFVHAPNQCLIQQREVGTHTLNFANALRAALREDPDVILVGETRDSETARISVQAALSGRLVITSLHATDALATIYRLFQMDIEPYLVAASLRGVIAQRLVRKVCEYCAEEYKPSKEELLTLAGIDLPAKFKLRRGQGCSVCRHSGYRDRVGVYQVFEVSDNMREMISRRPDPYDLANLANTEGLKSLETEAYILAVAGMTTVQEATRLVTKDVQ